MCYDSPMRRLALAALGLLLTALPVHAADTLTRSPPALQRWPVRPCRGRRAGSDGASTAPLTRPGSSSAASSSSSPGQRATRGLASARESLRTATPAAPLSRAARTVDRPGRGALSRRPLRRRGGAVRAFARSLGRPRPDRARTRARLVGDRPRPARAVRPAEERAAIYARILERMRAELAVDGGLAPGSYWTGRGRTRRRRSRAGVAGGDCRLGPRAQAPDGGAALAPISIGSSPRPSSPTAQPA